MESFFERKNGEEWRGSRANARFLLTQADGRVNLDVMLVGIRRTEAHSSINTIFAPMHRGIVNCGLWLLIWFEINHSLADGSSIFADFLIIFVIRRSFVHPSFLLHLLCVAVLLSSQHQISTMAVRSNDTIPSLMLVTVVRTVSHLGTYTAYSLFFPVSQTQQQHRLNRLPRRLTP